MRKDWAGTAGKNSTLWGRTDLRAIAVLLGSRPYFFGDGPTTIDAIAYGFLANLFFVPVETELQRIGLEYDNLRLYCERLGQGLGLVASAAGSPDAD